MLPVLFAVTLFSSALLLLAVQPMAGKDLLPLVGGTPATWTTCLVFFQAVLLLGYLYAHRISAGTSLLRQSVIHGMIGIGALIAALLLRPDPTWIPEDADYPTLGLTAYLAALIGLPFFALSATAPLLQAWFARSRHRSASDPYFLYAASNAGSLLGLLAYPFLVEPWFALDEQRIGWVFGFAGVMGLMVVCGATVMLGGKRAEPTDASLIPDVEPSQSVTRARQLRWVFLAALPSSLLLSVTTHLTTDVAPVPLLWVVPLALYLGTFIVAFAWWPTVARRLLGRIAPMLLVFLAVALLTGATEPPVLVAVIHLAAFVAVALLCHGELAADRPDRTHLTRFYLAVSVGGVAGGLFNALVAPVIFSHFGLLEYPLGVILAALVRPRIDGESVRFTTRDFAYFLGFTLIAMALTVLVPVLVPIPSDAEPASVMVPRLIRSGLAIGLPGVLVFVLVWNPRRFAACLAALFVVGQFGPGNYGETLLTTRNFFGTLRVTRSTDGKFVRLVHGTTLHGQQRHDEPGPPRPLMYYHRRGPVGRLFEKLPAERKKRVAVIGLGCGAMAAYGQPGEAWTFYEIDPAVVRIARDSGYFAFLPDCRADWRIVIGDARRQLAHEPDGSFDLIALDAFSSDAIPVHLLTREAFARYAKKLASGGVMAFHLSNRYLDLPPMVARLAADHDPAFTCKLDEDGVSDAERADGKFPSIWVVVSRDLDDLGAVARDPHWQPLPPKPGPVWRDDFSNLLAVWK